MTDHNGKPQNRDFPSLAILAVGFAGGVLANLLVAAIDWIPEVAVAHPLFGAPFLTFLAVVLIVAIFYNPLKSLLSRGTLTIKWGDKEISITEIEGKVDKEFGDFESRIDNIAVEIEGLKRSTLKVEEGPAVTEEQQAGRGAGIRDAIKNVFSEVISDDLATIMFHLGSTDYKWRNQETLSKRTGLGGETINSLVLSVPDLVIRSKAKSGNTIYRLTDDAKRRLRQVT